jgi:hypothetical protein
MPIAITKRWMGSRRLVTNPHVEHTGEQQAVLGPTMADIQNLNQVGMHGTYIDGYGPKAHNASKDKPSWTAAFFR